MKKETERKIGIYVSRLRSGVAYLGAAGLLLCLGCDSIWGSWLVTRCSKPSTEYRPQIIQLPPGVFLMGSPPTEEGRFINATTGMDEEVQHGVKIQTAFWISDTEVTQSQYQAVVGSNPSEFNSSGDSADRPVEKVSWISAIKFCNQLSEKEHLEACYQISADGKSADWVKGLSCTGYRLPTEAEWEYAGRASDSTKYSGSNDVDVVSWNGKNSDGSTHAVKGKQPNGWHLYDMAGNVWEWVWDYYQEPYPASTLENPLIDPIGPASGDVRVFRGGSWVADAKGVAVLRLANRRRYYADTTIQNDLGFRVARTSTPAELPAPISGSNCASVEP